MFFKFKKSKEIDFWEWFVKHSHEYFHFKENQNFLFQQLKEKLNEIDHNLVFSFSANLRDQKREFIISAGGIVSSFPAVKKLVEAAPSLKNWHIIAFRQPQSGDFVVQYQDVSIGVQDVFFELINIDKGNGSKIDIKLHVKDYEESAPNWYTASFLLLDNVLGEYDTEMSLRNIVCTRLDETQRDQLRPISDLAKMVQALKSLA